MTVFGGEREDGLFAEQITGLKFTVFFRSLSKSIGTRVMSARGFGTRVMKVQSCSFGNSRGLLLRNKGFFSKVDDLHGIFGNEKVFLW